MSEAVAGLDDNKVEPERERRQRRPVREYTHGSEHEASAVQSGPLAPIHGFLWQAIVAPPAPAHLDDDEGRWRPRIDRDEVELRMPDPHAATEHLPAKPLQVASDQRLRIVARALGTGPHPSSLAMVVLPALRHRSPAASWALTRGSPGDQPGLTRRSARAHLRITRRHRDTGACFQDAVSPPARAWASVSSRMIDSASAIAAAAAGSG